MKELIELLNSKERKVLQVAFFALCLSVVFLTFVSAWEKGRIENLRAEVANRRKTWEQAQEALEKSKRLWLQWSATRRDLDDLKNNWYYRGEEGIREMRVDLGQVMSRAGLTLPPIQYNYQELEKGRIRKISFNFRLTTSYFSLRHLMAELESYPKFLCLERVEFQNVADHGSRLDLRVAIAGYYVE